MDEGKESNTWIEKIQELGLNWASCKALPKNDKAPPLQTVLDCLGTALAGFFGALPNTSFSQNVGLIALTGIMSRVVVTPIFIDEKIPPEGFVDEIR